MEDKTVLEVLVNLVPYGNVARRKPAAVISVTNDLSYPDDSHGNYVYTLVEYPAGGAQMIRGGRVIGYQRSAGALALVQCVLNDAVGASGLAAADIEATALLMSMMQNVSKSNGWQPAPTVSGKIAQISNLVAGMRDDFERLGTELATMRAANAELQQQLSRLEDDLK